MILIIRWAPVRHGRPGDEISAMAVAINMSRLRMMAFSVMAELY